MKVSSHVTGTIVGNNSSVINEPIVFKMPVGARSTFPNKDQVLQNPSGFKNISSLCMKMPPIFPRSSTLKNLGRLAKISFEESESHLMEIGFDGENYGKSKVFLPDLPLIIKW
ncbi:MAG: hypothetical protein GY710_16760 [Desulfobacteraceae bacterium]|nr:hypothetical protein [Desulfobacteraceae bacterium]